MKHEDTTTDLLIGLFIGIPISIGFTFYYTWMITKLVLWYDVPLQLTFRQWFGIDAILTIILMWAKSSKRETIKNAFSNTFSNAFNYSFLFGMLYIISKFI